MRVASAASSDQVLKSDLPNRVRETSLQPRNTRSLRYRNTARDKRRRRNTIAPTTDPAIIPRKSFDFEGMEGWVLDSLAVPVELGAPPEALVVGDDGIEGCVLQPCSRNTIRVKS